MSTSSVSTAGFTLKTGRFGAGASSSPSSRFKGKIKSRSITLSMGESHWNTDLLIGRAMILAVGVCLIALPPCTARRWRFSARYLFLERRLHMALLFPLSWCIVLARVKRVEVNDSYTYATSEPTLTPSAKQVLLRSWTAQGNQPAQRAAVRVSRMAMWRWRWRRGEKAWQRVATLSVHLIDASHMCIPRASRFFNGPARKAKMGLSLKNWYLYAFENLDCSSGTDGRRYSLQSMSISRTFPTHFLLRRALGGITLSSAVCFEAPIHPLKYLGEL